MDNALIDFSSPISKKNGNMLDPLVPLPHCHTNNIQENLESAVEGDNPFDNVILQLCKFDDPFEVTEKLAFEQKKDDNQVLQSQNIENKLTTNDQPTAGKQETDNEVKAVNVNECNSPQLNSISRLDFSNIEPCITPDNGHSTSLNKRSMSESCLSPAIGSIEKKFSKLYLSAQLDKQLLDESSKCNSSADQDLSLADVSKISVFDKSERSINSPVAIPKRKEEVKAFVANRIEKCIEKALNQSRQSLNCSFRHRRSLSAASLYTDSIFQCENPYNYSSLKPSFESSRIVSKFRNRSFSNHDLHSSLNTNIWGNDHNVFDLFNGETLANATNRFNTAFRKSTATSSMFTSYGQCDVGFLKSTSTHPSSSSFLNFSSTEKDYGKDNDSVFLKDDTVNMGGKSSSCVFMEAKNLSSILERRSRAADDEPLEVDFNFLTDDKFHVELVDSDSSCSENDVEGRSDQQGKGKGLKTGVSNEPKITLGPEDAPLPLCREKLAAMRLHSNRLQTKKLRSPVLVPPPPVPLPSTANSGNLVLKPRSQSDSKVGKRGPMKAMIPLGNMMRHEAKKENVVPSKQANGRPYRGETKSLPSNSSLRRSTTGDAVQKNKVSPPTMAQLSTPAAPLCQPVACSTPDGVLPLVSPSVTLQVSSITGVTPLDPGHRRSKSEQHISSVKPEMESEMTSPVTRNPLGRVRSKSGTSKKKQQFSQNAARNSFSPSQTPVSTSTPLKPITKNSPTLNRMKKPSSVNRKLLQRDNHVGKENQPRIDHKHRPVVRPAMGRVEV